MRCSCVSPPGRPVSFLAMGMMAASCSSTQSSMKTTSTDTSDATGTLNPPLPSRVSMAIPCWMKVVVICPSDAACSTHVTQMGSIRTKILTPSTSLTVHRRHASFSSSCFLLPLPSSTTTAALSRHRSPLVSASRCFGCPCLLASSSCNSCSTASP
uniref:Uncharacterized protein n=1 Tax=Arundo donax TaxID=35708 RepID=A0A0A9E6H0_ARUDO